MNEQSSSERIPVVQSTGMEVSVPEGMQVGCSDANAIPLDAFGDGGLIRPPMVDLLFPEVVFPSPRVAQVAGTEKIRELVFHHHELIWHSSIQPIFGHNEEHFWHAVGITADFHIEACGGPKSYTNRRGHPHLRERHFPFTITENDREIWLELYVQALHDVTFPAEVVEEYWRWIESLSIRMINRRTRSEEPIRVPFASIAERL